jgi:hypothetical protein
MAIVGVTPPGSTKPGCLCSAWPKEPNSFTETLSQPPAPDSWSVYPVRRSGTGHPTERNASASTWVARTYPVLVVAGLVGGAVAAVGGTVVAAPAVLEVEA